MYQSLHAGMGAAVLRHLSQFASLDGLLDKHGAKGGFIAGQAVASAVSELFYAGCAVSYNDVDAFLFSDNFAQQRRVLSLLEFEELTRTVQYDHIVLSTEAVYTVVQTRREGMLNEVLCRLAYRDAFLETDVLAQAFLKSFDLNCVQVAVRLSDQQLVWTPAFEAFLANRELLVMNVKTPIHTAVRWFRKKVELAGVYGHDDKTMELLASSVARVQARRAKWGGSAKFDIMKAWEAQVAFGKGYSAKAASVASDLSRYFDLVPVTGKHIALNTLVPRGCERPELVETDCLDMLLPTYARALQGHWRRHVCEQVKAALELPGTSLRLISVALDGPEKAADGRWMRELARLDKILEEHAGLQHLMGRMDTARQLVFVDAVRAIAQREGLWVYGVFEQLYEMPRELSTMALAQMPPYLEDLFAKQVAHFEEQSRTAVRPQACLPDMEWAGYRVTELVSFKAMLEEGVRMHHCVGGYFGSMLEGRCRILRLQRPRVQDSLTLELRRAGRGWAVAQLRGLQNHPASDEQLQAFKDLALRLNLQCAATALGLPLSWARADWLAGRYPGLAVKLEQAVTGDWRAHLKQRWRSVRARWLPGGQRLSARKTPSFRSRLAGLLPWVPAPTLEPEPLYEDMDEIPF